jgi:hypothetical protein
MCFRNHNFKHPCQLLNSLPLHSVLTEGRAIAQAVSRRLPTAAARVRSQVRSCGICGGQSGTGEGFIRVLRFLLANSHSAKCSIPIYRPGLVQ